jgi:hypothetical protein
VRERPLLFEAPQHNAIRWAHHARYINKGDGMLVISESLYYGILALPILGFVLGALWMRQKIGAPKLRPPQEVTPIPLREPGLETQILEALDSVQSQLSELAERQDFAERILTQEPGRLGADDPTPLPTPV